MADGYLEKHYADYEARKAEWLRKKSRLPKKPTRMLNVSKPEDEAL